MVLASCSSVTMELERPEMILVKLPDFNVCEDYDSIFPAVSRWHIKIEGEDCSEDFFVEDSKFYVSLKTNRLTGITAFPLTEGSSVKGEKNGENTGNFAVDLKTCDGDFVAGDKKEVLFFCCAGTVLPYCDFCKNEFFEISLNWEDGFCAYVLQKVFEGAFKSRSESSDFVTKFNWKKMLETVRSKIEASELEFECGDNNQGIFYNPWLLDLETVVQKITDGSFTVSCLGVKSVLSIDCAEAGVLNEFVFSDLAHTDESRGFENVEAAKKLVSAFVLENTVIQKYGRVCIKKSGINLFMTDNSKGVMITGNKEKNLSVRSVYMPIFCKGYEYSE